MDNDLGEISPLIHDSIVTFLTRLGEVKPHKPDSNNQKIHNLSFLSEIHQSTLLSHLVSSLVTFSNFIIHNLYFSILAISYQFILPHSQYAFRYT
jgi:hypothetical protein